MKVMAINSSARVGQQMFVEQKYTVEGDLTLLMRMSEFLGD